MIHISNQKPREMTYTRENSENCEGYCLSNCCDASISDEGDICMSRGCHEHCSTQCTDCEEPCEDFKEI